MTKNKNLPTPKDSRSSRMLVHESITKSSPIPLADEFAKYEQALPGAGQQIIDMAKEQQKIQHKTLDYSKETDHKMINHGTLKHSTTVVGIVAIVGISLYAPRGLQTGEIIIAGTLLTLAFNWGSIIDIAKQLFHFFSKH